MSSASKPTPGRRCAASIVEWYEDLDQSGGKRNRPGLDTFVDVVVDVGDAVDDPHDTSLQRRRLRRAAGETLDPVAHGLAEVQARTSALEHFDDARRVLEMAKVRAEAFAQTGVDDGLAGVAEGRVAEVVAEADRLDEVLIERQRARSASPRACVMRARW